MSTWTTRLFMGARSEVELVDLRDHLGDAAADELALLAQRRDFRRGAGRLAEPRARRVDFALEPRDFVEGPRAIGPEAVNHSHELSDFFFEAINRLQIHGGGGTGHRLLRSLTVRSPA